MHRRSGQRRQTAAGTMVSVSPSLGKLPPGRVGDMRPLCSTGQPPGPAHIDVRPAATQAPPHHALQRTRPQRSPYHQPSGPGHSSLSANNDPVCNTAAAPCVATLQRDCHCHARRYATSALQGTPVDPKKKQQPWGGGEVNRGGGKVRYKVVLPVHRG